MRRRGAFLLRAASFVWSIPSRLREHPGAEQPWRLPVRSRAERGLEAPRLSEASRDDRSRADSTALRVTSRRTTPPLRRGQRPHPMRRRGAIRAESVLSRWGRGSRAAEFLASPKRPKPALESASALTGTYSTGTAKAAMSADLARECGRRNSAFPGDGSVVVDMTRSWKWPATTKRGRHCRSPSAPNA